MGFMHWAFSSFAFCIFRSEHWRTQRWENTAFLDKKDAETLYSNEDVACVFIVCDLLHEKLLSLYPLTVTGCVAEQCYTFMFVEKRVWYRVRGLCVELLASFNELVEAGTCAGLVTDASEDSLCLIRLIWNGYVGYLHVLKSMMRMRTSGFTWVTPTPTLTHSLVCPHHLCVVVVVRGHTYTYMMCS